MMTDDERHHLALALVPGLGPKLTAALLAEFGSPTRILTLTASQLIRVPLIGEKLATQFEKSFREIRTDREEALMAKHGVRIAVRGSAEYPTRLDTISSPPGLVYLRGAFAPSDANSIGIVGSRNCTPYGKRMTERLAAGLARAGWTVVSGLARGIDGVAHQAALDAGGRTIAVLAGGLSRIYPPEHDRLAEAVVGNGCLITETPMTVEPQPGMFPARNRIISALSRAVVVVEANVRSGALITVTHAAEQGREVFAVPGPVDSVMSAGCLELIRKGARLIRDADDLLEDLRGLAMPDPPAAKRPTVPAPIDPAEPSEPPEVTAPPTPTPPLDENQRKIWDALGEPKLADELCRATNLGAAEVTRLLMQMELKRLVKKLAGGRYERR